MELQTRIFIIYQYNSKLEFSLFNIENSSL